MGWLWLFAAGAVEIVMAVALKYSQAWTRPGPSALGIGAALASIYLLTRALAHLPLGTAYAIWTGIGSLGVVPLGMLLWGESVSWSRLALIAMIVAGTVGFRLQQA
jgi:quaternary ammonium compound-resistance protein SugE